MAFPNSATSTSVTVMSLVSPDITENGVLEKALRPGDWEQMGLLFRIGAIGVVYGVGRRHSFKDAVVGKR